MWWIVSAVVLAGAGLVVLGLFTLRLWRQVRQFGRDVAAAGERITQASDELQRAAPPPR
ncbi:MAG: hypothetical protein QOJ03_1639 [Frankiaceae bacterium]|jgi:hypothetical protein|nr:hypothetical protein [Frankiaceae bacterium]